MQSTVRFWDFLSVLLFSKIFCRCRRQCRKQVKDRFCKVKFKIAWFKQLKPVLDWARTRDMSMFMLAQLLKFYWFFNSFALELIKCYLKARRFLLVQEVCSCFRDRPTISTAIKSYCNSCLEISLSRQSRNSQFEFKIFTGNWQVECTAHGKFQASYQVESGWALNF